MPCLDWGRSCDSGLGGGGKRGGAQGHRSICFTFQKKMQNIFPHSLISGGKSFARRQGGGESDFWAAAFSLRHQFDDQLLLSRTHLVLPRRLCECRPQPTLLAHKPPGKIFILRLIIQFTILLDTLVFIWFFHLRLITQSTRRLPSAPKETFLHTQLRLCQR